MSSTDKPLTLKDVQKHILVAIIVAVITGIVSGIGTGVGVYYKTVDKVDEHTTVIADLTKNVGDLTKMVNDLKTETAVASVSPGNLQKQIDEVKQSVSKLNDKTDKIYDLLLQRQK